MTTEAERAPAPPPLNETTAGNYFVSNYPPFSFWSEDHLGEAEAALARAPKPGTKLGLYLHIPFCRKRCHFCYFRVYTDKDSIQIRNYINTAIRELEMYASQPFIGGRKPHFVYFGGGTPSYLSVDQLTLLMGEMKRLLPWDEAQEVAFECEPGTLTEPKIKAIRELGVTRLSLGVENFDDHVLEINGRAHRSKEIWRAYEYARSLDFPQINIDLIAGMVEETEANWRECVRKTIDLAPDSVTIYQMEIPYNTTIYKEMKAEGKLVAPVADWPTKRSWVDYAFNEFARAGYSVTSAYTVVRNPEKTKFVYRDQVWSGADMVALGVASFSHVGGTHFQNLADFDPYLAKLNEGKLPHWRAYTPTSDERLIREWILQHKLGKLRVSYFTEKFGVDPRERFAEPLSKLAADGWLKVEGDELTLTRAALLQVDRLIHHYFLPQHLSARYT
ncbi:MAG: coproporphyrinogen III oxidase family protein [Planctomycetota bacterium]|nr:coproporphyrinogen III oxidase family protein [Planctomycetota bacterium]